ncbi:MAG: hypothetical protein FJ301_06755 [Planctomycetes bacterium]|nr:hypothetical protein [Planctomycetota bacterium]
MHVGQFPASAANSLIQGYCDDFVSLASVLAQTLEQISMRGIPIDSSRASLERIENGMRNLADAIHELLERGKVSGNLAGALNGASKPQPNAARARPTPQPALTEAAPARAAPGLRPASFGAAATTPAMPTAARPAATAPAPTFHPAAAPAVEGLRGTSQSMPLLSVFQFLSRMRKAGVMRVRLNGEDLLFEMQSGCITATASNNCPHAEQLDALLVEGDACTAEALDPILGRIPPTRAEAFADAAVAAGVVTEAQIFDAMATQQNRRYTRACRSDNAVYEFVEGARQKHGGRLRPPPMPVA